MVRPGALNLLRGLWLSLPVTVGPAVEAALTATSTPVVVVVNALLWTAWAGVLLALLVPRALSLTALRLGVPAVAVVAVVGAIRGGVETADLVAVAVAALVAVVAAWPTVGAELVDGSSYGPERRLPLRVPPAVAVGPAPIAVLAVLAGVAAGPVLLAAQQWIAGAAATAAGAVVVVVGARALHGLSRRFCVFVPGGIVVHDPLTLVDPVLLAKERLGTIGPAPVGTDAEDLTMGAGGLAIELRLQAPSDLVRRRPGRSAAEVVRTAAVLVAPTRPAAFLDESRARGLPVP